MRLGKAEWISDYNGSEALGSLGVILSGTLGNNLATKLGQLSAWSRWNLPGPPMEMTWPSRLVCLALVVPGVLVAGAIGIAGKDCGRAARGSRLVFQPAAQVLNKGFLVPGSKLKTWLAMLKKRMRCPGSVRNGP